MIAEQGKDGDNFKKYMCDISDLTLTFLEVGGRCRVEDMVIGSEKPETGKPDVWKDPLWWIFKSPKS